MQHATTRGKILYLREGEEIGRENFTITKHGDGARTFRALCEMDDHELLRDVTYSVDADWKPLDCFVRLTLHDKFVGSSWFNFDATGAECEGFTVKEGRFRQRLDIGERPKSFGAHPIICDIWHLAQFNKAGPKQQEWTALMSSPEPDGGTGPMLSKIDLTVKHFGVEELTVPAGTYQADHWSFVLRRPHTGDEELWTLGDDLIPLKIAYPIYNSTYELAELEIG